jgi:hypothetical protein
MRRLILLGGFALLIFNVLTFFFFLKERELEKKENSWNTYSFSRPEKNKTFFIQKENLSLKLTFRSGSLLTFFSSAEVELKKGSIYITGRASRGVFLGKKLTLLNFSGSACGWDFRAKKFVLYLDKPELVTLTKYSFRKGKELFKGVSTSTFELEKLCAFLKKERKTPH